MSFKPVYNFFFTVKILSVRFLLTHPVIQSSSSSRIPSRWSRWTCTTRPCAPTACPSWPGSSSPPSSRSARTTSTSPLCPTARLRYRKIGSYFSTPFMQTTLNLNLSSFFAHYSQFIFFFCLQTILSIFLIFLQTTLNFFFLQTIFEFFVLIGRSFPWH